MTQHQFLGNLMGVALALYFLAIVLVPVSNAIYDNLSDSPYDLYIYYDEFANTKVLYNYLSERGWINDEVTFKEFDYIVVLVQQLSTFYDNINPSDILAQIAVESRFDRDAEYEGALGLMQLLPIYHQTRMEKFVEADHVVDLEDFSTPRLNIMTGMDYMSYILTETDGDLTYALMWYNQGPTSASIDYLDNLITSEYAKTITELSSEINHFLTTKEDRYVPCTS